MNKMTNEELQREKDKMGILFNKNKKNVNEKDFVYDVQEDFDPYEDNEWDINEDDGDII